MKILVADDHQSVVDDVVYELEELYPDAEVTGTSVASEILPLCREKHFDVVILDIDLGSENGIQIAKSIQAEQPRVNIVYITGYEGYALESFETNVSSFLLKPITTAKIEKAMRSLRFPVSGITDEMITGLNKGDAVIGKRIRKHREERGMSPDEFSAEIGVDTSTVYRWEKGSRVPDVVTLLQIARVLGIGLKDLIGE
jgi:DNA-binding LytR/AlgR family response regulator